MAASIVFITGGDAWARAVYAREGRGDWAQAFPLVLEKLGYLGFSVAPAEALGDPALWEAHAAVLVPRLGEDAWNSDAIALAASGRAELLVELPPAQLRAAAGVDAVTPMTTNGTVIAAAAWLAEAVANEATRDNAKIEPPTTRPVERRPEQDWRRLGVPISDAQAEAWRTPSWDAQRWKLQPGVDELATWVAQDGTRSPAIVRRGHVTSCAFSLFSFLGQQTTIAPFSGPEHVNWPRPIALEAMLCALVDDMHRRRRTPRPRVRPWPAGARWVLNVRHDVDRPQSLDEIQTVLDRHERAGTSATWYWRARHLSDPAAVAAARAVANRSTHEVALHSERLWSTAEDERAAIERATRRPLRGSSAHGDPTCFRWQGAPNVLWADQHGLDYTEFISHTHLHPHRFAALGVDGVIRSRRVICLPHHESFDRSTKPGDAAIDSVRAAVAAYRKAEGMMQVLNHPDINIDELFALLTRLPREQRLDWTAAEASDWWRRTHVRGELQLSQAPDGSVEVTSRRGVRGLVLEILAFDGRRREYSITLDPGESLVVGGPDGDAAAWDPKQRWTAAVAPAFVAATKAYYAERDIDPDSPASRSTISTNSELVPGRVDAIRRYASELAGAQRWDDARVLDVGSGFGAFAACLALHRDVAHVTGVEVRPELVEQASRTAAQGGVRNVRYVAADMRHLAGIADGAHDVIVVNNSFIYLESRRAMRDAAAALARVAAPDGLLIMFHANRWQLREPFTRAPIVHLLPRPIANAVAYVAGWQHSHDRVTLVGAGALRRTLLRAGFTDVRIGVVRRGRVDRSARARFGRYYAVVARR